MGHLFVVLLPLGFDTLGVSLSMGMKGGGEKKQGSRSFLHLWLLPALFFAASEMSMPLLGLAIGYELSWLLHAPMQMIGPALLIGMGLWELIGELRELGNRRAAQKQVPTSQQVVASSHASPLAALPRWMQHALLALFVSADELILGFSLGSMTTLAVNGKTLPILILCILIGLQGGCMTIIGLILGRLLGSYARRLKQWHEWIASVLLIGLGIWLWFWPR